MRPFEDDELSDQELDALLPEWSIPPAPARLRAAVFPDRSRPWWRRLWTASVRVPAPVACCLMVLLALGAWRWVVPTTPRVLIRTERVEVPVTKTEVVTKTVFRDRVVRVRVPVPERNLSELQPVAELRPRVIRSGHVQN